GLSARVVSVVSEEVRRWAAIRAALPPSVLPPPVLGTQLLRVPELRHFAQTRPHRRPRLSRDPAHLGYLTPLSGSVLPLSALLGLRAQRNRDRWLRPELMRSGCHRQ